MNKIIQLSLAVLMSSAAVASATSIDQQIQQIEHAPVSQRFKLMNQFKIRLRNMNQQERIEAINTLRKQMHANSSSKQIQANGANSNAMQTGNRMGHYPNNINQIQQTSTMMHTNVEQNQFQQQAIKQFNQQQYNFKPQQMNQPQQTNQPIRIPMH